MLMKRKKYRFYDMVTMSFKTSPFYSTIFLLRTITTAVLPTVSIFATADFLNLAVAVVNKDKDLSSLCKPIVIIAGIMVYKAIINVIMNTIECKRVIYFRKKLVPEIIMIEAGLEFYNIENPQIMDLITRVCPSFENHIWAMYTSVLEVVNLVVYVLGISSALFIQVWWLATIMLFTSIPILYIATRAGQRSYDVDRDMSQIDRKVDYLSSVMKSRDAVEERSLYGYTKFLNNRYAEKFDFAYKYRLRIRLSNIIKEKTGGIVTAIYSVAVMIAMVPLVLSGQMDTGMFISLIGAVFGLTDRLSWGVNELIEDVVKGLEYLNDLTEFMQLEKSENALSLPKYNMDFKTIEFLDVSFKYPGTEKLILDHISFIIEKGKHYSFVGVNGAGKTTIIKLLTGLYTNYDGTILIDGISLRNFSQAEIKGLSSIVYQDFSRYYISLYDNVAI